MFFRGVPDKIELTFLVLTWVLGDYLMRTLAYYSWLFIRVIILRSSLNYNFYNCLGWICTLSFNNTFPLNFPIQKHFFILNHHTLFCKSFSINKPLLKFRTKNPTNLGKLAEKLVHGHTPDRFVFWQMYNLGTGKGVSVLRLLQVFESVTKTKVPYNIEARRDGDIVSMFANTSLAFQELGWESKYNIEQMCK